MFNQKSIIENTIAGILSGGVMLIIMNNKESLSIGVPLWVVLVFTTLLIYLVILSSTRFNAANKIGINLVDKSLSREVLKKISMAENYSAAIEIQDRRIRDFQDACMKTLKEIQRNNKNSNCIEIQAGDITKDPYIWLGRAEAYIKYNKEIIEEGGRVKRVLFVRRSLLKENSYVQGLKKLIEILQDGKVEVGLHIFEDFKDVEDFVVFPKICVLKEIVQPDKNSSGGTSIAYFDEFSINNFELKFPRYFSESSQRCAKEFINNNFTSALTDDQIGHLSRVA